jgi:hypothetical protein
MEQLLSRGHCLYICIDKHIHPIGSDLTLSTFPPEAEDYLLYLFLYL